MSLEKYIQANGNLTDSAKNAIFSKEILTWKTWKTGKDETKGLENMENMEKIKAVDLSLSAYPWVCKGRCHGTGLLCASAGFPTW